MFGGKINTPDLTKSAETPIGLVHKMSISVHRQNLSFLLDFSCWKPFSTVPDLSKNENVEMFIDYKPIFQFI